MIYYNRKDTLVFYFQGQPFYASLVELLLPVLERVTYIPHNINYQELLSGNIGAHKS